VSVFTVNQKLQHQQRVLLEREGEKKKRNLLGMRVSDMGNLKRGKEGDKSKIRRTRWAAGSKEENQKKREIHFWEGGWKFLKGEKKREPFWNPPYKLYEEISSFVQGEEIPVSRQVSEGLRKWQGGMGAK